jgi:hypothetical protein
MNLKSLLAKPFANYIYKQIQKSKQTAVQDQEDILKSLVKSAKIRNLVKTMVLPRSAAMKILKCVPIRDYEQLKPYIEKIKEGKQNVLWKGKPIYFAKTSGTTSGVKYIPITKDSIPNHINTARNALLCYMAETVITILQAAR